MQKINKSVIKNLLPKRPENSHKGTFGHVLNIAGCENYRGAAFLSSISALKVGCGRVTLASEAEALQASASLSPDIILHPVEKINNEFLNKFQAVSIGCGLSQNSKSKNILKKTIKNLKDTKIPLVIDADGLNILASLPHFHKENGQLPLNTILTPHPKEMSKLMNISVENILKQPEYWAKKCSEKFSCVTVLKLHETIITDKSENIYVNKTGNSALSHGGSGDVLCGMIAGFLAQGLNCFEASVLAVYLHGLTAEIASKELTEYSTLASDLLKYIPEAIKSIL